MNQIIAPRGLLAVRAEGDISSQVKALMEEFQQLYSEDRQRVHEEINGLRNMLTELEQGQAAGTFSAGSFGPDLAATLASSEAFEAVAGKRITKSSVDVKAVDLLKVQANTITYDGGGLDVTDGRPEIVTGMQRKRWLRQRLVTIPTTGGSVEYSRELAFTNNAAPQGGGSPFEHEGVAKAESSLTFEQVDTKVATIAHFIKASKQILGDVPMLRATLDTRLKYGLEIATEAQIISGTGTGANMAGLTTAGNFTAFTPTSGDTAIDSVNRALATLETNEASPDVVIMHPTDFRAMQRLKASGSGEYVFGSPSGANGANVWNTEVHLTPAISTGKFIAMDSTQMGVLFLREDAQVQVGFVNDDFTKNLVVLLAELRAVLAVQRPAAVIYGSLTL